MTNTSAVTPPKVSKKEARQLIYNKLAEVLVEFKPYIKKKKFDNTMLKVTKLLAADLFTKPRKNGKKTKEVKKKKEATAGPEVVTA